MRCNPIAASLASCVTAAAIGFTLMPAAVQAGPAADADGALFAPIVKVLREPRCMNCHPVDDRPRQGDDRHVHQMNVQRGEDNLGFVNLRCTACHRDENNPHAIVPGAPNWHLAPLSMGWQGLDDAAICSALLDTAKNGGKTLDQIVEHLRSDPLVLWGWAPGKGRNPVSTPHAEFMTQVEAWQKAGAPCPASQSHKTQSP